MQVILPRGLIVDPQNVPTDFDERVRESFRAYTKGTRPEYMYQDKLGYIDTVRSSFNKIDDSFEAVKDMILRSVEYSLDEHGELMKTEDFWDVDFMASCYEKGDRDSRLYGHYTGDSRLDDALMSLLARVISVVMDYGKEQPTVEQPRWIPVTERLPTEEDADHRGCVIAVSRVDRGAKNWELESVLAYSDSFLCWFPMPPIPEESSVVGKED